MEGLGQQLGHVRWTNRTNIGQQIEIFVLAIVINLKHEQHMKKKLLLMRSSKIVNGNIVSLKVVHGRLVTLDKHFLFGNRSNNTERFEVSLIFSSDKG